MALKAVCVMKGDGATQGVINLCQEVCQVYSSGMSAWPSCLSTGR